MTHSRGNRSDKLKRLFAEWLKSYPTTHQEHFHKDGIVNEVRYRREASRILYVTLEPNSRDGRYNKYLGKDLRYMWGVKGLGKSFDLNLARWTAVLLDGETKYSSPNAEGAKQQLRRVAIMNLKKLAGSGKANHEAISVQAWRDKDYIRRQVEIIQANRLFWSVINDDPLKELPKKSVWSHGQFRVLPANHPSLRPTNARDAFKRVVDTAKKWKVGALGTK